MLARLSFLEPKPPNELSSLTFPFRRLGALLRCGLFRRRLAAPGSQRGAGWEIAHHFAAIFTRRFAGLLFAPVNGVAEHPRASRGATNEVHLKSVRLFLGARFGVDAFDVLLGVGIGSFPHNEFFWPNELSVRSTFRLCKCTPHEFSDFSTRREQSRCGQLPHRRFYVINSAREQDETGVTFLAQPPD